MARIIQVLVMGSGLGFTRHVTIRKRVLIRVFGLCIGLRVVGGYYWV